MNRHLSLSRFLKTKSAFHAFALLAILLSTLAPQGFMPTQTTDGFAIKLCSGHANNLLTVAADDPDYALLKLVYGDKQNDTPEPASKQDTSVCAFAFGSAFGPAAEGPMLSPPTLQPATHEPSEPRRFALRNRVNIPPATGPPVISQTI
ncbi:hypothetical protein [Parasphingorhabdus sp.]|uniref:hypothetical protein n=1 Tax=Parasphingorhabdus sp. TaxID=2709688 RepID=UPI003A940A16